MDKFRQPQKYPNKPLFVKYIDNFPQNHFYNVDLIKHKE